MTNQNPTPFNMGYTQSTASASTNAFVDYFSSDRNPTASDVNFPIQKKWYNVNTGEYWMLEAFATSQNIVSAVWVKIAATGHVEFLQGNSGLPVGPSNNVINVVGDGVYLTTVGTPLNNTLTIEPAGGIATSFAEDLGTATASSGTLNVKGYTGITGAGSGIATSGLGNSIGISLHSPYTLSDFEFLGNNPNTPRFLQIFNQHNSSGSDAAVQIVTAGSSSGDPYILFWSGNNNSAVVGYLNSVNEFVIGTGTGQQTAQSIPKQFLIRPTTPDILLQVPVVTQNTASATGALFTIQNTDPSAGATVQANLIAGSSSSDSWISFNDFSTSSIYHIGKTGGSQLFKIGYGASDLTSANAILVFNQSTSTTYLQNANVLMPGTCAVLATTSVSSINVTGDGTAYTVIFDNEIVDQNSNYNPTTGVFTAPATGIYLVSATVTLSGLGASNTHDNSLLIGAPGVPYKQDLGNLSAVADSVSGDYTVSITRICNLSINDTFTIVLTVSGGTKTVSVAGSPANSFSQLSVQLLC